MLHRMVFKSYAGAYGAFTRMHMHPEDFYTDPDSEDEEDSDEEDGDHDTPDHEPLADFE